jgi:hypothetical protein
MVVLCKLLEKLPPSFRGIPSCDGRNKKESEGKREGKEEWGGHTRS